MRAHGCKYMCGIAEGPFMGRQGRECLNRWGGCQYYDRSEWEWNGSAGVRHRMGNVHRWLSVP